MVGSAFQATSTSYPAGPRHAPAGGSGRNIIAERPDHSIAGRAGSVCSGIIAAAMIGSSQTRSWRGAVGYADALRHHLHPCETSMAHNYDAASHIGVCEMGYRRDRMGYLRCGLPVLRALKPRPQHQLKDGPRRPWIVPRHHHDAADAAHGQVGMSACPSPISDYVCLCALHLR